MTATIPKRRWTGHQSRQSESVALSAVFRCLRKAWPNKTLSTIKTYYYEKSGLRQETEIARALADCGKLDHAVSRCAPLMAVLAGIELPDSVIEAVSDSSMPDLLEDVDKEAFLLDPSKENARKLLREKLKQLNANLKAIACLEIYLSA